MDEPTNRSDPAAARPATSTVTIVDPSGGPIMFVHLDGDVLCLEFESYALPSDPGGPDIEYLARIPSTELPKIYQHFSIDSSLPILGAIQLLSDSGQGPEFIAEVRAGRIAPESQLHWYSWDDLPTRRTEGLVDTRDSRTHATSEIRRDATREADGGDDPRRSAPTEGHTVGEERTRRPEPPILSTHSIPNGDSGPADPKTSPCLGHRSG